MCIWSNYGMIHCPEARLFLASCPNPGHHSSDSQRGRLYCSTCWNVCMQRDDMANPINKKLPLIFWISDSSLQYYAVVGVHPTMMGCWGAPKKKLRCIIFIFGGLSPKHHGLSWSFYYAGGRFDIRGIERKGSFRVSPGHCFSEKAFETEVKRYLFSFFYVQDCVILVLPFDPNIPTTYKSYCTQWQVIRKLNYS